LVIFNFRLAALMARLRSSENIDGIAVIIRDKSGREQVLTAGSFSEPDAAIRACMTMAAHLKDADLGDSSITRTG
jgi:hypothetical protein